MYSSKLVKLFTLMAIHGFCLGATAASATLNARQPSTDLFHEDLPKLSDIAIINDDKALHRKEEITIFAQSLIAITKLNPKWTSSLFIRNETTDAVKLHKTLEESGEVIAAVDFQYTTISATDYDVTSGYGQIFAHPTADTKYRWPYALFIGASNSAGWSRALNDFRGPDLVKRTLEILTGFAAAHSTMGTDESDVPIYNALRSAESSPVLLQLSSFDGKDSMKDLNWESWVTVMAFREDDSGSQLDYATSFSPKNKGLTQTVDWHEVEPHVISAVFL